MGALTRDQILKVEDIKTQKINVPEWGGDVWVRGLSGKQRDAIEASMLLIGQNGKKITQSYKLENMRARVCALCLCDERGQPLFTEADIPALGAKSAAALDRVYTVAQEISGLGADDVAALTDSLKKDQPGASHSG